VSAAESGKRIITPRRDVVEAIIADWVKPPVARPVEDVWSEVPDRISEHVEPLSGRGSGHEARGVARWLEVSVPNALPRST